MNHDTSGKAADNALKTVTIGTIRMKKDAALEEIKRLRK
jgi:hypothetical protein